MNKKISRIVATIMLVIGAIFIVFAMNNPQASFPWKSSITYILYGIYLMTIVILYIAPSKKK